MFDLKSLTKEAIPAALAKAVRYRLLNEPGAAESICLDVLRTDPENQEALVTLLLALTDRFTRGYSVGALDARDVAAKLKDPYERAYYSGIVHERKAKVRLHDGASHDAYEQLREAMTRYEEAEALRPADNADALLRWNACARMIMSNRLEARSAEETAGVEMD
jgi:hypothetical protein